VQKIVDVQGEEQEACAQALDVEAWLVAQELEPVLAQDGVEVVVEEG
jgi:hypothetical protein